MVDDRELRRYVRIVAEWATPEEIELILKEAKTPDDVLVLLRHVKERKTAWDWNNGGWQRLKVIGRWLLAFGAFAMALNALRAAYDWARIFTGQ